MAISLAAALLSGLLVYGIYWLQLRHIRLEEKVPVVVPKQFIPAGTVLDKSMLTTALIPRSSLKEDMLSRPSDADGMQTFAPLGTGEPLLDWKVSMYPLLPKEGEETFQVPRDYIKSVSNGIRAGDWVVVYLSSEAEGSRRLYAEPVIVAAVKTAANTEIDDPSNPSVLSMASGDKEKMYASRRDANGNIDAVNLNLTERQWLEMDAACKDGNGKLVIAFASSAPGMDGKEAGS
nr:SAF domain-containing protein [Cohnella zeiphila]